LTCDFFEKCTKNKARRLIERSQYSEVIAENAARMEINLALYLRRQAIVEHHYGIINRQWRFYYIMTKRAVRRASADVGLMAVAFNLCRIFNISEPIVLGSHLKSPFPTFWTLMTDFASFYRRYFTLFKVAHLIYATYHRLAYP